MKQKKKANDCGNKLCSRNELRVSEIHSSHLGEKKRAKD